MKKIPVEQAVGMTLCHDVTAMRDGFKGELTYLRLSYDMCKAAQKDMVISDIRLIRKSGGIHGDYERKAE